VTIVITFLRWIGTYNTLMSPLSRRGKAILQAVFVTVLWSSSWILIKIGLRNSLPAITFAGLRYTLASLFLAPFVFFNPAQRMALKWLTGKEWGKLALLGIIYYSITQSAMFLALATLPANMVSLLLNLTSVFVGIAGISLLKEYPAPLQWAGIGLAALGVGVYFFPFILPPAQYLGITIGLVCMGANVAAVLFGRQVNRTSSIPPLLVTFISMGIGSVLMLLTGLLTQGLGEMTADAWLIIAWLALVNTALSFTLWNHSLQVLSAVESSILNSLMLPQIALLGYFFLGEGMSLKAVAGLVLVGVGTIIVQLKPGRVTQPDAA
jgi:drug/metabolite transporter (DMT)-like permease